ncbi:MAG: transketolase family protein [Lachnospiraceae bacterium]|uniref:Transketolase family protein n=1 Tax=Candidatus Weimeria bifida TaxID=2599074 RepID=A0A6N7J232_9FIRM|nr:transketolase family protein [Candidatus Weimeria bifida]RRF95986.1 MAG: transketolase family protein [Lachnospiraceae bacterium]
MINIDRTSKNLLRDVVGDITTSIGEENDKVAVVNADLMGTCRMRSFNKKFPDRCFNVGIAEQQMVSFAAGLAHEGFIPFAFTMAPFISMRACESVRDDVAYANANVRLMGTYAGVSGGISGATHWSVEDVGIMTSIPNITVIEISDPTEADQLLRQSLDQNGPFYFRYGIIPVPSIYKKNYHFEIGRAEVLNKGNDGAFIVSGVTVPYAIEASNRIEEKTGRHIMVIDMHTIKPIDRDAVMLAAETGNIVCAEDHNIYGGLGSQVAMVLAEEGLAVHFKNIGVPDRFVAMAHAPYLYHEFGYDAEGLEAAMMSMISEDK